MTTWAEKQMYHAGQEARRDGLSIAEALFKFGPHFTSRRERDAFRDGWHGNPQPETIRIKAL